MINKQELAKAKRERKAAKSNATKYSKWSTSAAADEVRKNWKSAAQLKAEMEKAAEEAQKAAEEAAGVKTEKKVEETTSV